MKKIRIGNRLVGEGEPCFVIAEAGVNHNGDIRLAKKLVTEAKKAGADAVKFQTWKTEEIVNKKVPKPLYQKNTWGRSQFEMLKKLELSDEEFRRIAEYSKKIGIIFMSTPEGQKCVDLIAKLGVPAFKVGSADLTNHLHLAYVAKKGKPIILSTGMSTLEEVKEAVEVIKRSGNDRVILLHCTSLYPTKIEDTNLLAMITLRKKFGLPVGYSDHTTTIGVPIIAALLGASVIEKHLTLSRDLPGPDHKISLEPCEFEEMVKGIRLSEKTPVVVDRLMERLMQISREVSIEKEVLEKIELILGSPVKKPVPAEKEMIALMRKYIVAKKDIKRGCIITRDMLSIKRSGGGLEPKHLDEIIGKRAIANIRKDEAITFEKVMA
jgi:N-acetylneuraminate synthase/N,N'-diacetyllegionaminate synthase